MRGTGTKLPGFRDTSTRMRMDAPSGIPSASEAFAGASEPPAAKSDKKGRKRKKNLRKRFRSFRLNDQEHAALIRAAGDVPLGAYIRSKLFDKPLPDYYSRRPRHPVKDEQILGQLLGQLGKARLANNLNQLARAANTGSLPVTAETERALQEACAEVQAMRKALMQALGFPVEDRP